MTVRYPVDTDWVIDHLNQIERVVTRRQELRPQGLAISIISLAELYEGVRYSRHPEQSQQALDAFLEDVPPWALMRRSVSCSGESGHGCGSGVP